MSYDFSFSKKTLAFALAGFAFVGIVLFVAGLLIGTSWKAEQTAAASVASKQTAVTPASEPPAAPQEPVLKADVEPPGAGAPGEADASGGASSSVKQAHSDAANVEIKATQPSSPASSKDGELKIIQEAESESEDMAAFSVQVGVFLSENDAHQLVRQLQKKGYTPIVLAATDDEGRLWYSVRIGAFTNKADAALAASNIAAQEKLKAVVRPLGSL